MGGREIHDGRDRETYIGDGDRITHKGGRTKLFKRGEGTEYRGGGQNYAHFGNRRTHKQTGGHTKRQLDIQKCM